MKYLALASIVIVLLLPTITLGAQTSPLNSVLPYDPVSKPFEPYEAKVVEPVYSWVRLDDWQGQYILIQNQNGDYCLPEFSYCAGW